MGLGSPGSKSTFGSSSNKSSNFGSSASKASNFGSSASKTSHFGSSPTKNSAFGSLTKKTNTLGAQPQKEPSYARGPSFLVGGSKVSSGLTPSTSRKTYETVSYNPKSAKSSTSFGIIWLPGRKRNKKKEVAYSAINDDRKTERTPTMYNIMSGDSTDYQISKKKDEESSHIIPEKVKGPIATVASAGAVTIISEVPSESPITELEEKLLSHDKDDTKAAAGDANEMNEKEDSDFLENKDVSDKLPKSKLEEKSADKVDSALILSPGLKPPPPQSNNSNPDDDECIIKCLYYTLQCCDCVLM